MTDGPLDLERVKSVTMGEFIDIFEVQLIHSTVSESLLRVAVC